MTGFAPSRGAKINPNVRTINRCDHSTDAAASSQIAASRRRDPARQRAAEPPQDLAHPAGESGVERRGLAAVGLQHEQVDPRVLGELAHVLDGPVGRAVVNHEHLDRWIQARTRPGRRRMPVAILRFTAGVHAKWPPHLTL
jgi:hypothetical protein